MTSISINMRGIHGDAFCRQDDITYRVPVEHTGDYKTGLLVMFHLIDPKPPEEARAQVIARLKLELAAWAKANERAVRW